MQLSIRPRLLSIHRKAVALDENSLNTPGIPILFDNHNIIIQFMLSLPHT